MTFFFQARSNSRLPSTPGWSVAQSTALIGIQRQSMQVDMAVWDGPWCARPLSSEWTARQASCIRLAANHRLPGYQYRRML